MKGYYQKSLTIRTPDFQNLNEDYDILKIINHECQENHIYDYEIISISCLYDKYFIVVLKVLRGE